MRRLSPGYAKRGKQVIVSEVPFKELLPLKLKTQVSSKGERAVKAHCVQEMSVFFACLKKNEFIERHCGPELASFQKCVKEYEASAKKQAAGSKLGELVPGEKDLNHHQITTLLKKFPG